MPDGKASDAEMESENEEDDVAFYKNKYRKLKDRLKYLICVSSLGGVLTLSSPDVVVCMFVYVSINTDETTSLQTKLPTSLLSRDAPKFLLFTHTHVHTHTHCHWCPAFCRNTSALKMTSRRHRPGCCSCPETRGKRSERKSFVLRMVVCGKVGMQLYPAINQPSV